jgi:broad specificity phosphatase PhoE
VPDQTTIFLCRHASPENPDGVFYGHLPGFGLGKAGRRQALGLGSFLAAYPIRKLYSSPLERALETAELAASQLPTPVEIELRDDLLEAEWGKYLQGVPRAQAAYRRPLLMFHALVPGFLAMDETVPEMAERVGRVCDEALKACRGEAAAIVSHADPIKAFWNQHLRRADWRFHFLELPKGGFVELTYRGDELVQVRPHGPILDSRTQAPAV